MNKVKTCNRCGVTKEHSYFYVNERKPSGTIVLDSQCKECVKADRKANYGGVRDRALKTMKAYHQRIKRETLEAYGGVWCVKCGRSDLAALTLDHIHSDGRLHRKALFGNNGQYASAAFYRILRKQDYPPGFQVLCSSCNLAKHILGGDLSKVIPTYEGVTTIPQGSTAKWLEAHHALTDHPKGDDIV